MSQLISIAALLVCPEDIVPPPVSGIGVVVGVGGTSVAIGVSVGIAVGLGDGVGVGVGVGVVVGVGVGAVVGSPASDLRASIWA